jgi:hypothetical protein
MLTLTTWATDMPAFIDPEARRIFLQEIAHLRYLRGVYRRDADDDDLSYSAQLKGRLRADGCNRAICSLRDVWAGLVAVERRHAEEYLAAAEVDRP